MTKKSYSPKRQSKQPKGRQSPKQTNKKPENIRSDKKSFLGKWGGILFSAVTLALSLLVLWPRLSVDPGEMLNDRKPFTTSFVVANDGYLFCYPVRFSLSVKQMNLQNNINFTNDEFSGFERDIPTLCPNDKSSLPLGRTLDMPPNFVESAEIYIEISYKPSWIPVWIPSWVQVKLNSFFSDSYRFKTARKVNGEYIWQRYYKDK
jgi:hypothetical protein